jgi:phosphoglycolate phosphatase
MTGRIVFDLDGTLIDSAPDIQKIANEVLANASASPISLAETRSFIGEGIHVFVARMRAARDIPDSEQTRLLDDIVRRYDSAVSLTVTYPGVVDALQALRKKYRLGICTNKLHSPCVAVLKHLQIDQYFDTIWGGDNPLGRKPDPAPLLAAFGELGDGPSVYVGDSEIDAATAQSAGVPFFVFTEGYRKKTLAEIPHQIAFADFKELPALVETHFGS